MNSSRQEVTAVREEIVKVVVGVVGEVGDQETIAGIGMVVAIVRISVEIEEGDVGSSVHPIHHQKARQRQNSG